MPLNTREGVADEPMEPRLRTLCEPCVTGPRLKLWRLIVPAKPLPIEMPVTLIASPGSNTSTVTGSPTTASLCPRNSTRCLCGFVSVFFRCPRRGFVTFRSGTSSNASWTAS